jgi:hypothetical protein
VAYPSVLPICDRSLRQRYRCDILGGGTR